MKNQINELVSSYGVDAFTPDPVPTGDAHKGRPADQHDTHTDEPENYEQDPKPGSEHPAVVELPSPDAVPSRAEMMADLIHGFSGMTHPDLGAVYAQLAQLGGIGLNPHTGRFADQYTGDDDDRLDFEDVREDVAVVLKDAGLDEAVIDKAAAIFTNSVRNKTIEAVMEAQSILDESNAAALAAKMELLEKDNESFMDSLAERWLQENQVAVKQSFRTELAESFLAGLKELFDTHYIYIPESKVDVVESLVAEVENLKSQLDKYQAASSRLSEDHKEIDAAKAELTEAATAGLTDADRQRVSDLAGYISFDSVNQFASALTRIVEGVTSATAARGDSSLMEDDLSLEEPPVSDADPQMNRVAEQMGRLIAGAKE